MILTEDMKRVVREQRLAFVATVSEDGTPNLSPKGTIAVWDDEHLAFADLRSPGTVANVRERPVVEINVVDPIARTGYRFKGRATVLDEGPELEAAVAFYEDANPPIGRARERVRSVVIVAVEQASPLVSPAYDLGQTQDEIRERWLAHYLWLHERYARGRHDETPG
jgi:predicted pyridoxine 5'-phosphate oxidase superfamily flavin-nucleotide-binding protein